MTLSEYRETYSWQSAIALGPQLMQLAEELPASEENGLSFQLRSLMVELPSSIAADLLADRPATLTPVLKLIAAVELIDNVFPALDTAATQTSLEELTNRLASENFDERTGGSVSVKPADVPIPAAAATPPAETPVLAAEVTPPTVVVPVAAQTPVEETDVHPDSVQ
jgi:hypothetical protein